MACAPPVRLSALAQALGFSATGGPGRYPHRMYPPMHFDATFKRLAHKLRRVSREALVD